MYQTTAVVPTQSASRYITRLCKHWGHKFDVEFDEQHGVINFGDSQCHLEALDDDLLIIIKAGQSQLDELEEVVKDHLQRFNRSDNEVLVFEWARKKL